MSKQIAFSNDSGAIDTISAESVVITRPTSRSVKTLVIINTSANTGWFKFDDSDNWILLPANSTEPYTLILRQIVMTNDLIVKPGSGNPTVYATVY